MWQRILIAAALAGTAGHAAAMDLDLSLSDETAEIGVVGNPQTGASDRAEAGAALFFTDDSDFVGSGFWHITGRLREGFEPLKFGAGVKVYGADLDAADTTVGALALGGSLRYDIPNLQVPLAATVQGHMAPDITTTGRGDGMTELVGRVEARFARTASAYVGYRYLRFDVEHARDARLDTNFHVGLRMQF
ncbi:YfaZ family protein [Salinisphaera sp. PC39]|uniref:YfaZ family outer membrane protein n=1 Tax=Salinisphaera sp. PC39 TaxID=1304156 RepID=UPI00333F61A4